MSFGNGSFPGQEQKQQARAQEECLQSRQERRQQPEGDLLFRVKGWTEGWTDISTFFFSLELRNSHSLLLLASKEGWRQDGCVLSIFNLGIYHLWQDFSFTVSIDINPVPVFRSWGRLFGGWFFFFVVVCFILFGFVSVLFFNARIHFP